MCEETCQACQSKHDSLRDRVVEAAERFVSTFENISSTQEQTFESIQLLFDAVREFREDK